MHRVLEQPGGGWLCVGDGDLAGGARAVGLDVEERAAVVDAVRTAACFREKKSQWKLQTLRLRRVISSICSIIVEILKGSFGQQTCCTGFLVYFVRESS